MDRRALSQAAVQADRHAFVARPHRTLVALSLPVLVSLIAEPLTGLVDTFFVARLGAAELAALGAATVLLSSIFWVFNFLGIGTQTEVARGLGESEPARSRDATGLALALALAIGCSLALLAWPCLGLAMAFMSDAPEIRAPGITYLEIRLLSAPAVLLTLAAFGALRGLQDMRTPLWIAVGANALNAALDPLLIFGLGPFPELGIAGAAWATVLSHWLGAVAALFAVRRRPGLPPRVRWRDARRLLAVGRDLFLRTGLLIAFIVLATRAATRLGVDAGAAHQAIRQVWLLTALVLDAYAATAQSLVGYFLGASRAALARHVAWVASLWSVGTGVALCAAMLAGTTTVGLLLVPETARPTFAAAWWVAAAAQPINALSFATDGILWGGRDYRYLRNAMFAATGLGSTALLLLPAAGGDTLVHIWLVTAGWIAVRSAFGVARVWPGIGASPFREPA